MVAPVVLDVEVAVAGLRQGDLGQRSSESFLCPISWAVLMPTPPRTPTDNATPIFPNQFKPPSKPSQPRSEAVNR